MSIFLHHDSYVSAYPCNTIGQCLFTYDSHENMETVNIILDVRMQASLII